MQLALLRKKDNAYTASISASTGVSIQMRSIIELSWYHITLCPGFTSIPTSGFAPWVSGEVSSHCLLRLRVQRRKKSISIDAGHRYQLLRGSGDSLRGLTLDGLRLEREGYG